IQTPYDSPTCVTRKWLRGRLCSTKRDQQARVDKCRIGAVVMLRSAGVGIVRVGASNPQKGDYLLKIARNGHFARYNTGSPPVIPTSLPTVCLPRDWPVHQAAKSGMIRP